MQNKTNFIISKILLFVPLLIILLVVIYQSGILSSGTNQITVKEQVKIEQMLMQEVKEIWAKGQIDRLSEKQKLECSDSLPTGKQVGEDFYQCNPYFLDCILKDATKMHLFEYKIGSKKYRFTPQKLRENYFLYKKQGKIEIAFLKPTNGEVLKLMLESNCVEVFLPEGYYSAGERNISDQLWDNFGQAVYVDKYYVSNQDVLLWKKESGTLSEEDKKILRQKPYYPSTNLSIEEKRQFCADQGKDLIHSHYFDAASYLNVEMKKKMMKNKFPFHWTKKRTREMDNIKSSDCFNIYSKECEKIRPYKFYEPLATSWMGMHFTLGNYPEFLPNLFEPTQNLKKSSFYLDHKDKWHEIGKRMDIAELINEKDLMSENVEVAFRCMRVY